ncbi:MAG: NADH:flavin oxidoreductase/NADH oxidase [Burkholderiales bacterium]|nr:NADH:flavin oxidoreductase/NADH oxidase [Burkholderiales bacterium]
MSASALFSALTLRGLVLRNRVVLSPMCQYSAVEGLANDWHLAHLGKFATGGMGLVFTEATAVERDGRITHGDLGLWSDAHIEPLARAVRFVKANGAAAGIQIAHAGRKASMQRPWHGNGPLDDTDRARGEDTWNVIAPSAVPLDTGWLVPHAMSLADIARVKAAFVATAKRALDAGFDVAEVHGAHGYLLHEFLSPISNLRTDAYGGSFDNRIRLALEITEAVRAVWPDDRPLFFRVSAVDGVDGGWTLDESVSLARRLKSLGVDVVDCSSGGIAGSATAARIKRFPGFQVPYAAQIRHDVGVPTMAVGLIMEPRMAEDILQRREADLIAIGREALHDPHWALHAEAALGIDNGFATWPPQYGWWLDKRQQALGRTPMA